MIHWDANQKNCLTFANLFASIEMTMVQSALTNAWR